MNSESPDLIRPARSIFGMLLVMFFLSGVSALMCQIVWAHELELVFGVTLYATSAVVTTFMAGLAFGSLFFGRLVDRWKSPLVLFALLEAGIGLFALAFPFLLVTLRHIYVLFYGPFGDNRPVMNLGRFALAFLMLIVPTSLMGGTLPAITRAYVLQGRQVGRNVASLYSANNLGAFAGCLAAGYVFLELLGPTGSLRLAAFLSLSVAVLALLANRATGVQEGATREPEAEGAPAPGPVALSRPVKVALWVFGLEGITSLIYQMAWMRMLIFFVRADIYGVTSIVSTFLLGLSLGAFIARRWVDRVKDPYRALAFIELGMGLSALATLPLLPSLLGVQHSVLDTLARVHGGGLPYAIMGSAANFAVTLLVVLVPTTCTGATLPVVSRIYVSELHGLGRKIGVLGCLDTVGSIFGALAGGFLLIPILGTQRTIIATVLVNLTLSAWVFATDPIPRRRPARRAGVIGVSLALLGTAGLLFVQPTPLIKYSEVLADKPFRTLIESREDQVCSASVAEEVEFNRTLYVNDHAVASTDHYDRPSHELMLHVPLLLNPDPKRALIIGLGLGLSVGACLPHNVQVDVVELSPSVLAVNHCFDSCFEEYRKEHGGKSVLTDPRVHVRIDDGRNYVLGTSEKYDVIQVGGCHPTYSSGAASFYTLDFYKDCQRILTPDGIFTQWLPCHQIPHEDFKTILRSFRAGFPYSAICYKYTSDFCMLVGALKPPKVDFQNLERRVKQPAVARSLLRCNVQDPVDILDYFCLSGEGIAKAVGRGPLQTDRHPYIEYHRFRERPNDGLRNLRLISQARERCWPELVNIPPEREAAVRAQLEKWYQGTQVLLAAQYAEACQELASEQKYVTQEQRQERMRRTADFFKRMADRQKGAPQDESAPRLDYDYEDFFPLTAGLFERAVKMNPADINAAFLYNRYRAHWDNFLGFKCLEEGRGEEGLRYLEQAAQTSPDTYFGAEARFQLKKSKAESERRQLDDSGP